MTARFEVKAAAAVVVVLSLSLSRPSPLASDALITVVAKEPPTASAPAPPPRVAEEPNPVGGCVPVVKLPKAPQKVHDSKPLWSGLNVQTRGGTLVYDITIGPSGSVTDVHRIRRGRSAGPSKVIADAWLDAIREWKFEPTVIDGERVAVCMTVTVTIDI